MNRSQHQKLMSKGNTMYKNSQSRDNANRGRFSGGNDSSTTEVEVEKHGSKRGQRIAIKGCGGIEKADEQGALGSRKTFGFGRDGGGNSSNGDAGGYEKHGLYLHEEGAEHVAHLNDPSKSRITKKVPPKSKLIAGHDRQATGNDIRDGVEPALNARRATRLDMSVSHRFHDDE
jgi:hypothetical protein